MSPLKERYPTLAALIAVLKSFTTFQSRLASQGTTYDVTLQRSCLSMPHPMINLDDIKGNIYANRTCAQILQKVDQKSRQRSKMPLMSFLPNLRPRVCHHIWHTKDCRATHCKDFSVEAKATFATFGGCFGQQRMLGGNLPPPPIICLAERAQGEHLRNTRSFLAKCYQNGHQRSKIAVS